MKGRVVARLWSQGDHNTALFPTATTVFKYYTDQQMIAYGTRPTSDVAVAQLTKFQEIPPAEI